jgi:hypothetical protein
LAFAGCLGGRADAERRVIRALVAHTLAPVPHKLVTDENLERHNTIGVAR